MGSGKMFLRLGLCTVFSISLVYGLSAYQKEEPDDRKGGMVRFGKLHHVGHIVEDFEAGLKLYEDKFGLTPHGDIIEAPPALGSRIIFFTIGDQMVELIGPGGVETDPASQCLKERGEGLFQFAFVPDDYDREVKLLREKGFTVEEITLPGAYPGYEARSAFIAPEETQGLWIELIDQASRPPRE